MNRWNTLLVAAAVLAPATAEAQKPSSNMHTRSAETYLSQAEREPVLEDKKVALQNALEAAFEGVASSPDNPLSWFQAGQAYVGLQDWAGADSTFDRAVQLYPEYAEEIDPVRQNAWVQAYNTGVTALQENNLEAAISSLEVANMLYDKRPEAMVTLGAIYLQQGRFDEAETIFQDALALLRGPLSEDLSEEEQASWAEDELTVALRLANMYADQEKFAEAEQVYRDLLESRPDNPMARANLAVVMSRAGKTEEAAAVYRELLSDEDLDEATVFNIGVGLFRAQDFAQAATAFERAVSINPVAHEALYNLGQSLFAQASALESEREGATAARAEEIKAELIRLNEALRDRAEQLLELDPTNRNAMMMLAQAYRSLAELGVGDEAALRNEALAVLEKHSALPFEVTNVTTVPGEGTVQIMGSVANLTAEPGSSLSFRVSVIDIDGTELAGEDITVTAPEAGQSTNFEATLTAPEGAAGWKYVITS